MFDKIYMHITTFNWLRDNLAKYESSSQRFYSGDYISFYGYEIVIENSLSETIDEGEGWIFPKEPFIRYEQKDREWCEYFGIGRQGRGFILGEIICFNPDFRINVDKMFKRKGHSSYCWK